MLGEAGRNAAPADGPARPGQSHPPKTAVGRANAHSGLAPTGSGKPLGINKALVRPQLGKARIHKGLAAVATNTRLRAVSAPDANDLPRHRRPPVFGHSSCNG